uniref:2-oxoglutarate-dependent dioxygenase n=1 Tax=Sinopodophyllum hexandrum TaxID=93608 RepID=A0A0N9HGU8_SINHE|nr:2-oxoglutarate-dependent dioxygenase [Sinopodophyllum hexandrum]
MTISNTSSVTKEPENYDRAKAVKDFDDSKIGVKGLLDSGITTIPQFFVHPPESLRTITTTSVSQTIPLIDLSQPRQTIVDQIRDASRTWGFFQILNHGIPPEFLDRLITSIKAFNEQPTETKAQHYSREIGRGVAFSTNFDLFQSKAASWRDTIQISLGPRQLDFNLVPEIFRKEVEEWNRHIGQLGESLMGILSEGLGLETDGLKKLTCLEGKLMVCHYYPHCPQPDRTVGIASHMDPGVLTVLVQDQIGGLQVKHGEEWVDVKPIPGALVINIGDLLQMISNDEYKSVEHRVLANPFQEPRISVGVFFNPSNRECLYGPLPELVSSEKPALYRQFTVQEFLGKFLTKGLDGRTLIDHFKV